MGFPVFDMPGRLKLAMQLNLPVLEAEEELKRGVRDERVYDVVLAATGSEEQAAVALRDRIAEKLRRGEEADV